MRTTPWGRILLLVGVLTLLYGGGTHARIPSPTLDARVSDVAPIVATAPRFATAIDTATQTREPTSIPDNPYLMTQAQLTAADTGGAFTYVETARVALILARDQF